MKTQLGSCTSFEFDHFAIQGTLSGPRGTGKCGTLNVGAPAVLALPESSAGTFLSLLDADQDLLNPIGLVDYRTQGGNCTASATMVVPLAGWFIPDVDDEVIVARSGEDVTSLLLPAVQAVVDSETFFTPAEMLQRRTHRRGDLLGAAVRSTRRATPLAGCRGRYRRL